MSKKGNFVSSKKRILECAKIFEATAKAIRENGGPQDEVEKAEIEAKRLRRLAGNWTDELEKLDRKYGGLDVKDD